MRQKNSLPADDGPEYDPATETYYAHYDWEDDGEPSRCVIETVAAATGTEPLDMEPLYDTVDPEYLDRVFEPRSGCSPSDGRITFRFQGCDVSVDTDGWTVVSPPDSEQP